MNESKLGQGSCLCGAVSFRAEQADLHAAACHCGMCATWGGGPLLAVDCGGEVSFEGEGDISRYDSSEWAERGFCRRCGTHLFYRLKAVDRYTVPAGLFDESGGFTLSQQIFIDKKPSFYDFANTTENMSEAEVFAMFAPSE